MEKKKPVPAQKSLLKNGQRNIMDINRSGQKGGCMSIAEHLDFRAASWLMKLTPDRFIPGLDLKMMYQNMYWSSVGYLWERLQIGPIDVDSVEQDFMKLLDFWKSVYLRKED